VNYSFNLITLITARTWKGWFCFEIGN